MAWIKLSGALQLLIINIVLQISTASPVSSPVTPNPKLILRAAEELHINQKRQGGFFSVLGVGALGDDTVYPRREVRDLEKDQDQWNVYMLGLSRFQNVSQSDKLSYYQIAGVHGRPYLSWDGVGQGAGGSGGYCPHGSNIFPTWHRPYLALYEEALYLNCRQVISEFPDGDLKTRYKKALVSFRMPYLDWAAPPPPGESPLPDCVQRETVDVVLPNGTTTMPNPLYSYRFQSLNVTDLGGTPWTTWPVTVRDPSSKNADAASRNDLIAHELDKNQPNLQSRIYSVLAMQHDYDKISNDLQPGDSIESVHDTVHNMLGSNGHMSYLSYASFDPIFWLHHCNVDRIFAIWQALNPNSYVTPVRNPYATFLMPKDFVADTNTVLAPFHKNDRGDFWTSETCRSTNVFAYTYPELVGVGNNTDSLKTKVNSLYGPDAITPRKRSHTPGHIAGAPNFAQRRQYTVDIKAYKFCVDGSFNVHIFLGPKPGSDAKNYSNEPSFIGMTGILSQSQGADTPNNNIGVHGAVPLTAALESKLCTGEIPNLTEGAVAAYLKENMTWRISKMNGDQVSVDDMPGFQVSVLWAEVEPAKDECDFPEIVSDYKVLADATNGLPGGFSPGDSL